MPAERKQLVRNAVADGNLVPELEAMLAASGATGHEFVAALSQGRRLSRSTFADVAHLLGLLHGNRPSVFEIVSQSPLVPSPAWLHAAMRAFAREREVVAQLILITGPPPSRAGQTSVEMSVTATRNALATLAGSDRLGCAIGAAVALLLDWEAISAAVRQIGREFDVNLADRHDEWPSRHESLGAVELAASLPGGERAVRFGFQTLLGQHFDFWNIIQCRAA